ncbi:MAG: carbohydrate kinase family protein [Clostridia bacterium]|nr:carbohydrate kinase family protein [Clostridia bacterium]
MEGRKYDVVTVGLQCIDVVMNSVSPSALSRDTTAVESARMMLGGDAANQAITLSRLGARVGLMGLVGNDLLGDVLLRQLSAYPMDLLDQREDVDTAISLVLVDPAGERHFIYQPASNNALSRRHIDDEAIRQAAFLSVGGCMLLPGLDGEGMCDMLDLARRSGTRTAMDFCVNGDLPDREGLSALLSRVDYALPSRIEAEAMVGPASTPGELVRRLRALGATNCIIKLGHEGCYVAADGFEGPVPPCPADCVDTTGAGDSFVAGFLYARTRGWEIERCARFANAVGAITVEHVGANGAIHSPEQVLDRMARIGEGWEAQ